MTGQSYGGVKVARHICLSTTSMLAMCLTMPAIARPKAPSFYHDTSKLDWS